MFREILLLQTVRHSGHRECKTSLTIDHVEGQGQNEVTKVLLRDVIYRMMRYIHRWTDFN